MYFRFKPYLRSFNLAPETQRNSLTTITLDNRTTEINQYAFYDCFKLKEVNLSYCISLTSIGYMAFGYCPELTEVELDNCTSLTSIGMYAFFEDNRLTSITLPSSLTSIEESAFQGCSGLTSIELPSSLTSIGSYAFSGCNNLGSIFLNTTGWYGTESEFMPGTPMDMSNPEQNATWLTDTYVNYYFRRNA